MLMWPGAASTAQTIAGMVMEFRYCQFGQMATVDGEVTSKTPKQRVIAFGAQLSPDFLVPSNFDWSNRKTSAMEVAQLKMASSNYTPSQLRDVQDRYAAVSYTHLDVYKRQPLGHTCYHRLFQS